MISVDKDTYCTPPWVLQPVYSFYKEIDLDPASGPGSIVKANKVFTKEDDGLTQNWFPYTRIFCNPPYSKPNLAKWSSYCAWHSCFLNTPEMLLLVPAYMSAKWYQNNVLATASAILFYNKRISFIMPDGSKSGSPTFHSCLVYWGPRINEFRQCFEHQGFIITL